MPHPIAIELAGEKEKFSLICRNSISLTAETFWDAFGSISDLEKALPQGSAIVLTMKDTGEITVASSGKATYIIKEKLIDYRHPEIIVLDPLNSYALEIGGKVFLIKPHQFDLKPVREGFFPGLLTGIKSLFKPQART